MTAVGLLQMDSVNVLARAHYLPVFSRLGPYRTDVLDQAAWPARTADRMLLETWAHVASLVPMQAEPLLRWRRSHFAEPWIADHHELAATVLELISERGPMSAGQIERELDASGPRRSGWWQWSATKRACEHLFAAGAIGTAYRRSFERRYDLLERIVPSAVRVLPTPAPGDAKRELIALAARHHGIGTAADLADYYRIKTGDARIALAELVEQGTVLPVAVAGWPEPAFLHRDAPLPRKVSGRALLCPFDPLIWERARTERLFSIRYRIEIYTPETKRTYGYYVFPLLLGDAIVGRFDLKADRNAGRLLVQAAWHEPGTDPVSVADAAVEELSRMAGWLGLSDVEVRDRGNLAGPLRDAVRSASGI